ncbi:MAG: replicative DNA helicase, partial [Bacilli bacterium]|nr:replicative DNA helicase [Bacilli bacterium]
MAERVMPQNIEAEMSVLGVAFLNPTAMESIMENMSEDMFFSDANKRVFQALSELYKNRTPIDITTVKNELDKQKNLNAIGGVEYLSEIVDSVATSANLNYYMEIVKDKATRRKLIDTATNIITDAYNETNGLTQILDTSETKLLNVVRTRKTSEFKPITEALREAHENLERLSKNKSAITGLPTGFIDLDKATSGLHEGEMIIIAARPGMGKTAFALNLAVNAAMSTDKAVAIFNLEMSAEQLVNRMISAVGQIEGDKLKTGMLSDNDWKRYTEAMSELSGTNIYIEDDASVTAPEIKAKCRRLASSPKGL